MNNKIAVIGIGRLGLCFALNLEKIGYKVYGVDINEEYVKQINLKQLKSNEPLVVDYLNESKKFIATTDSSVIERENIQFIYLILPTPSNADGTFSHIYIDNFFEELKQICSSKSQRHVIIGSTVMPGYCDSKSKELEKSNISITYNPEFIAQGSIIHDQQRPDQILIGEGHEDATKFLKDVYSKMCLSNPEIHVMSRLSAEITKLATNCYLTMKISFANSIGDLAKLAGANEQSILKAIGSDSRIGHKYLNYGFGFGGPCFPRDNQALIAFSKSKNITIPLSEATVEVNKTHLQFQLNELLNENKEVYYFDSITYKEETDIIEASQQLELAKLLIENGKKVVIKSSKLIQQEIESLFPTYFNFED